MAKNQTYTRIRETELKTIEKYLNRKNDRARKLRPIPILESGSKSIPRYGVEDLADVVITAIADGDLVQYDSATATWINVTVASLGVTNLWFRRGTALEPLTAGDTVSYSANSTTALKVEQNGVHDDTLVVDTTNGAVGMTADVTVTAGTLTSDVADDISVYIDSDIGPVANTTTVSKMSIDEIVIGTDPGVGGVRAIASATIDDNYTIDFQNIVSLGARGTLSYKCLDLDILTYAPQSGVAATINLSAIDIDCSEIPGGWGVGTIYAGDFANFKIGGVEKCTIGVDGTVETPKVQGLADTDTYIIFGGNLVDIFAGGVDVLTVKTSEMVFNDTSVDIDCRFETNGNANMLFIDGGADCVGIGKVPTAGIELDIAGDTLATGYIKSSSPTAGIGYATGAGSTVTQLTSKSTTVTINAICGTITTHAAALNAATIVSFQVTNSACAATDVICIQHDSGGTIGAYTVMPNSPDAGHFHVTLRNNTAGNLSDTLVLRYAIIKAVVA